MAPVPWLGCCVTAAVENRAAVPAAATMSARMMGLSRSGVRQPRRGIRKNSGMFNDSAPWAPRCLLHFTGHRHVPLDCFVCPFQVSNLTINVASMANTVQINGEISLSFPPLRVIARSPGFRRWRRDVD